MSSEILDARRALSRLKRGVPPRNAAAIAVGMERLSSRSRALFRDDASPRWFAVAGEYGEGKSFFQALASQIAFESGYAVAVMDVNKDAGALHHPQRHLSLLLSSLQSPLPEFRCFQGFDEILRQWFDATPKSQVVATLSRMQSVVAWCNAGLDPDLFSALATRLVAGDKSPRIPVFRSPLAGANNDGEVLVDQNGTRYGRGALTRAVYCKPPGSSEWRYFAPPKDWAFLREQLARIPAWNAGNDGEGRRSYQFLGEMLSYLSGHLSGCFGDLAWKSAGARFAAAYRLQLAQEWLVATGHRGLLIFIDELDNVIQQIHARGHAACFRTLAFYCSCPQLAHVRVIFAATPEVIDMLDCGGRTRYLRELEQQVTVREEERTVYRRWKWEADALAAQGWERCSSLTPAQRVSLFRKIADLHALAWGVRVAPDECLVAALARKPQYTTTRQWVRASVQLLDILEQKLVRQPPPVAPVEKCPKCNRPLRKVKGPLRFFLGCTGYPECKFTRDLPK